MPASDKLPLGPGIKATNSKYNLWKFDLLVWPFLKTYGSTCYFRFNFVKHIELCLILYEELYLFFWFCTSKVAEQTFWWLFLLDIV